MNSGKPFTQTHNSGQYLTETTYPSDTWEKPRRLVVVRKQIKKRSKATGKQLKLFKEAIKPIGIPVISPTRSFPLLWIYHTLRKLKTTQPFTEHEKKKIDQKNRERIS